MLFYDTLRSSASPSTASGLKDKNECLITKQAYLPQVTLSVAYRKRALSHLLPETLSLTRRQLLCPLFLDEMQHVQQFSINAPRSDLKRQLVKGIREVRARTLLMNVTAIVLLNIIVLYSYYNSVI